MRLGILVAALSIAATVAVAGTTTPAVGPGRPANKTDDFGYRRRWATPWPATAGREQMICSVKAQALASGKVSKYTLSPRTAAPTSRSRTCRT